MKVLIIGDMHLGKAVRLYPSRDDVVLGKLASVLSKEKPSTIILAGDVFDTPSPRASLVSRLLDILASTDALVWAFDGNHDLGSKGSALDFFRSSTIQRSGIHVIDDPFRITTGGSTIHLVPWGKPFPDDVSDLDLIVGHGTHPDSPIAPPVIGNREEYAPTPEWSPTGNGLMGIVLGHLHHAHRFLCSMSGSGVYYTGPFVRMSFGDGDPGYVVFDGESIRSKPLDSTRFVELKDWDGESDAVVRAVVETQEEAEALKEKLSRANLMGYEVLVRTKAALNEASTSILEGFYRGHIVGAYINYRKATGREPVPEVVSMLKSLSS